jgi:biotin-(acetyl-CoA carboxylase) ligase/methylase of polypeptide subunit release factors
MERSTMVSREFFDFKDISRESDNVQFSGNSITWNGPANTTIATVVPNSVYPPREDSYLLATAISHRGEGGRKRFFEVGVGSGVVTAFASAHGWDVSGCDINPLAVSCTRGLLRERGVVANSIFEGGPGEEDNDEAADESNLAGYDWAGSGKYDVIAWNLPYLTPPESGEPHLGPFEEAGLVDFEDADSKLLDSLERNPQLLNRGGTVLLLCSNYANGLTLRSRWMARGWASRIIEQSKMDDGEILRVIELWLPWQDSKAMLVDEIDSTNTHLLASSGRQGDRIRAQRQLSGRGQRERKWNSADGDLTCSWLIHEGKIPTNGFELGMLQLEAALAVLDAIAALSGQILPSGGLPAIENIADLGFSVKWPNDIWYKGGKLAGILAESRSFQESMRIVLGIGINLVERNQVSNIITPLSTLADYDLALPSIVKIEAALNAALSSIFERRERPRNDHDETFMFTDEGITNTGAGELVFASVANHVGKYGNPTLNGDEITLQGISPSGALDLVDQNGIRHSIDDTSALIWHPSSEG